MSVYEAIMRVGSFDVQLRDDTPTSIINLVQPFDTIVVMPSRTGPEALSDYNMLNLARYSGVVLRPRTSDLKIEGVGPAAWLGIGDDIGPIMFNKTGTYTFNNWIAQLLPTAIVQNLIYAQAGDPGMNASFDMISARKAIEGVCAAYGCEYRVNNAFAIDAGSPAQLYPALQRPVYVVRTGFEGYDSRATVLPGQFAVDWDYTDYARGVILFAKGGSHQSLTPNPSTWRDPYGNSMAWQKVVQDQNVPLGWEAAAADNYLASYSNPQPKLTLSTDWYDIRGVFRPGDTIHVYDPLNGLVDTSNQRDYRGGSIFPKTVRAMGMRWLLRQGMGVYLRHHNGTSVTYTDLTPHIVWEAGPGDRYISEIEIGGFDGASGLSFPGGQDRTTYSRAGLGSWTPYPMKVYGESSDPAPGSSTVEGYYQLNGSTLHLRGKLIVGSGWVDGTGRFMVDLPNDLATPTEMYVTGTFLRPSLSQRVRITGLTYGPFSFHRMIFTMSDSNVDILANGMTAGWQIAWNGTLEVVV